MIDFDHRARRDRRGARAPGIAQRLRQDHRDAVSAKVKDSATGGPQAESRRMPGPARKPREAPQPPQAVPGVDRPARQAARQESAAPRSRRRRKRRWLDRLVRSEFAERRVAGGMRFLFAWSRAVGRRRAPRGSPADFTRDLRPCGPARTGSRRRISPPPIPEKSAEERAAILAGVWDNLARARRSSTPSSRIWSTASIRNGPARARSSVSAWSMSIALRDGGKPAILFGAHLGNWELTAGARREARPAGHAPSTGRRPTCTSPPRSSGGGATSSASWWCPGRGAALEVAEALKQGRAYRHASSTSASPTAR